MISVKGRDVADSIARGLEANDFGNVFIVIEYYNDVPIYHIHSDYVEYNKTIYSSDDKEKALYQARRLNASDVKAHISVEYDDNGEKRYDVNITSME